MKQYKTTCDRCGVEQSADEPSSQSTRLYGDQQAEVVFRPISLIDAWGYISQPNHNRNLDVCPPCLKAYHDEQERAFIRWMETK